MSQPDASHPNIVEDSDLGDTVPLSAETFAAIAQIYASTVEKEEDLVSSAGLSDKGNHDCDILRLVPDNYEARMAFHELAMDRSKLHEHHAQFIHITKQAPFCQGFDRDESGTSSSDDSYEPTSIHQGYFRIAFDCETLTTGAKWILGKGSVNKQCRNVDILLAKPGSPNKYHKYIAAAHVFLRIHPSSGAWLIRAGEFCRDVNGPGRVPRVVESPDGFEECTHTPLLFDREELKHGAFRCLSNPQSALVIGQLQFSVEFCIKEPRTEKWYIADRDAFLARQDAPLPITRISAIPFSSDTRTPWAVCREGLGSGAFGNVFEGFEPQTGDLRAVKKIVLKHEMEKPAVAQEIAANTQFGSFPGIVRFYGWSNSSGVSELVGRLPLEVYLVQEKGISFKDYDWDNYVDWDLRKQLYEQLLQGVRVIHAAGCMHRDITPMNILYFPDEPKHAALCDFGKLCHSTTAMDTALAGWHWLPPEIKKGQQYQYNQKIDIWLLGLALLETWFPDYHPRYRLGHDSRLHAEIDTRLEKLEAEKPESRAEIVMSIRTMLRWDAALRPSADEALEDPWMKAVITVEAERSSNVERKRKLDSQ